MRSRKCRQQRRMRVDHPAGESRKEHRSKYFHETRRHDQVGCVLLSGRGQSGVPGTPVRVITKSHTVGRDLCGGRNVLGRAVPVDSDGDDPSRIVPDGGLEQRLQQRSGPGGQHHQSRRRTRRYADRFWHGDEPSGGG